MNLRLYKSVVLAMVFAVNCQNAFAPVHVVGYYNTVFMVGSNLFSNPLNVDTNSLSELFSMQTPPQGATVSLWNPASVTFSNASKFTNGSWTSNLILPPGTGVLVIAPMQFTNTIVGFALNHDGSFVTNDTEGIPPVFSGFNGIYLFGDKSPTVDVGTNIFLNILGRLPFVGEKVIKLASTNTYLGNGAWDSVPTLGVSEAVFLDIKSEPPPWLSALYADQQVVVSWPSYASDWTLQTNVNLSGGTWGKYAGVIVNNAVTNAMPNGSLFFRLTYP